jgi:hypothetical protein
VEKARLYFDKLLCHSTHLGLFSEQIGRDGYQLGSFPQALTHLALKTIGYTARSLELGVDVALRTLWCEVNTPAVAQPASRTSLCEDSW